jgi:hypothetical protein
VPPATRSPTATFTAFTVRERQELTGIPILIAQDHERLRAATFSSARPPPGSLCRASATTELAVQALARRDPRRRPEARRVERQG